MWYASSWVFANTLQLNMGKSNRNVQPKDWGEITNVRTPTTYVVYSNGTCVIFVDDCTCDAYFWTRNVQLVLLVYWSVHGHWAGQDGRQVLWLSHVPKSLKGIYWFWHYIMTWICSMWCLEKSKPKSPNGGFFMIYNGIKQTTHLKQRNVFHHFRHLASHIPSPKPWGTRCFFQSGKRYVIVPWDM